jgi:transcriptional regulator with XRE-family HTH domain
MGHPLRLFRNSQNPPISLRRAAGALGISPASLSRIETGSQECRPELQRRIYEWSGGTISPNDLVLRPQHVEAAE